MALPAHLRLLTCFAVAFSVSDSLHAAAGRPADEAPLFHLSAYSTPLTPAADLNDRPSDQHREHPFMTTPDAAAAVPADAPAVIAPPAPVPAPTAAPASPAPVAVPHITIAVPRTPVILPLPATIAPPPLTMSATQQLAAQMALANYGWGADQWAALLTLWNRESGWDPSASNSSGAYGIPQALPGSKMSEAGDDWRTNPRTQISWGLSYINDRYGSPIAALAHSDAYNWY